MILMYRRATKKFLGRGVFLELGEFDKQSCTKRERKAPQGKFLTSGNS